MPQAVFHQAQRVVDRAFVGGQEPLHTVQCGCEAGMGYIGRMERRTKGVNHGQPCASNGDPHHTTEYHDSRPTWNLAKFFASQR